LKVEKALCSQISLLLKLQILYYEFTQTFLARKVLAIFDIFTTLDFQPGRENTCICEDKGKDTEIKACAGRAPAHAFISGASPRAVSC
jgi:hypothetical protein